MSINAKVVADSKNEFGNRITTMVVTFPRILLAEAKTHRVISDDTAIEISDAGFNDDIMFSRNSASSRAIPFNKMIQSIKDNPFVPMAWMKDHKGMQGTEYFTEQEIKELGLIEDWLADRDRVIESALKRSEKGVTKQIVNRQLETFAYHTCIVTATEWENFFALRCPQYEFKIDEIAGHSKYATARSWKEVIDHIYEPDFSTSYLESMTIVDRLKWNKGQAEIHMMALAEAMWDAYNESTPKELKAGEWHIPFENQIVQDNLEALEALMPEIQPASVNWYIDCLNQLKVKISTVMAARTSYTVVGEDQKPMTYQKMIELHDKMANANPIHASPFEHCAQAMSQDQMSTNGKLESLIKAGWQNGWCGNFKGFIQYRKMFVNENAV